MTHHSAGWRLGAFARHSVALTLAAALALPGSSSGQCQYELAGVILGPPCPPFGTPAPASSNAINDLGQVVGSHTQCGSSNVVAFVWSVETGLVTLPAPGGTAGWSAAYGINNHGEIVGTVRYDGMTHAVLWRDRVMIDLGVPEGGNFSEGEAINDRGQATGRWGNNVDGDPTRSSPFIWEDGEFRVFLTRGEDRAAVKDINEHGHIVGDLALPGGPHRAFVLHNGVTTELPFPPGALETRATAINGRGEVVGHSRYQESPPERHATLWRDGQAHDLGVLLGAWHLVPEHEPPESAAADINETGQIVGGSGSPSRGFLSQHGRMIDLRHLTMDLSGGDVTGARAVNNFGEIAAPWNHYGDVLLAPIDRPATDFDIDCQTAFSDLILLIAHWGSCECAYDLDGDGQVADSDLLIFLNSLG